MKTESETPKTDAEKCRHNSSHWLAGDEVVSALFAAELEKELEEYKSDAERFRWLIKQGLAWRECYDKSWIEGEWLYDVQNARAVVDEKRMAAMPNNRI